MSLDTSKYDDEHLYPGKSRAKTYRFNDTYKKSALVLWQHRPTFMGHE